MHNHDALLIYHITNQLYNEAGARIPEQAFRKKKNPASGMPLLPAGFVHPCIPMHCSLAAPPRSRERRGALPRVGNRYRVTAASTGSGGASAVIVPPSATVVLRRWKYAQITAAASGSTPSAMKTVSGRMRNQRMLVTSGWR